MEAGFARLLRSDFICVCLAIRKHIEILCWGHVDEGLIGSLRGGLFEFVEITLTHEGASLLLCDCFLVL